MWRSTKTGHGRRRWRGPAQSIGRAHGLPGQIGGEDFKPPQAGQMPGQETLKVSAWSVDDVARVPRSLGQYREAFVDAAVDGAFLYDLDDDDLRNTLGIEHRLHRKKILNMTTKLRAANKNATSKCASSCRRPDGWRRRRDAARPVLEDGRRRGEGGGGRRNRSTLTSPGRVKNRLRHAQEVDAAIQDERAVNLISTQVMALVPCGGLAPRTRSLRLRRKFDPAIVMPMSRTLAQRTSRHERETFNLNKVNEHGNTMLHVAAQNGNVKIAKLWSRRVPIRTIKQRRPNSRAFCQRIPVLRLSVVALRPQRWRRGRHAREHVRARAVRRALRGARERVRRLL